MKDNLVFNVVQLIIADFPEYPGLSLTVTLSGVEGPCYSDVFRVSCALYQFDFLLRLTIRYNAELVGIAGQMDNGVDFLVTDGVEFIPGNVFRIVVILRFRNVNGN